MSCPYQLLYLSSVIHRHPMQNLSPMFCSRSGPSTTHYWDRTCNDPVSARANFPSVLFSSVDLLVVWLNSNIFTHVVWRRSGCFGGGETPARERSKLWDCSSSWKKIEVTKQHWGNLVFLLRYRGHRALDKL